MISKVWFLPIHNKDLFTRGFALEEHIQQPYNYRKKEITICFTCAVTIFFFWLGSDELTCFHESRQRKREFMSKMIPYIPISVCYNELFISTSPFLLPSPSMANLGACAKQDPIILIQMTIPLQEEMGEYLEEEIMREVVQTKQHWSE